jgi:hypothetical protein
VGSLEASYISAGINRYYVAMDAERFGTRQPSFDLLTFINEWVAHSGPQPPVALLSGYGMGKTTFARHLAFTAAREWLECPGRRIPIFIDLGRISDEQSLEGLLGKVFTSDFRVGNYSFDLFMKLNRNGRFLVILDSFDEMRHGISITAFLRNMDEIKRLVDGDARVVVCGRPSAFMNEEEYRGALRDEHRVGGEWIKYSTFGSFIELSLSPLSDEQIKIFLRRYLLYLKESQTIKESAVKKVFAQLDGPYSESLYNLARRPVQLYMLATVLPQWKQSIDKLSRTLLYDHFIDQLIRREQKKGARGGIMPAVRRQFACELAYHLWNRTGQRYIRADDIPVELLQTVSKGQSKHSVLSTRELLVGSALDVKPPDLFYFPHRSIQEYLVAERLSELIGRRRPPVDELASVLSPEVRDFLQGIVSAASFEQWLFLLDRVRGELPVEIQELAFSFSTVINNHIARIEKFEGMVSAWPGLFLLRVRGEAMTRPSSHYTRIEFRQDLRRLISTSDELYGVCAVHLMFLYHLGTRPSDSIRLGDGKNLVNDLEFLHQQLTHRSHQKSRELLGTLSLYGGSHTLQTGALRKGLAEYYAVAPARLAEMIKSTEHPRLVYPFDLSCLSADFIGRIPSSWRSNSLISDDLRHRPCSLPASNSPSLAECQA